MSSAWSAPMKLPTFDALVAFHQSDPIGYEQFRTHTLNHAVACAPPERRPALARTLQTIEVARQAASSPLEAVMSAHRLMCDSLQDLKCSLHQLHYSCAEMQAIQIVDGLKENSKTNRA